MQFYEFLNLSLLERRVCLRILQFVVFDSCWVVPIFLFSFRLNIINICEVVDLECFNS